MDRLSFKYLFSPLPTSDFEYSKITLILAIALIIIGLLSAYYRKTKMKDEVARKILKKYPGKLINYGLILLALLGFRELSLPYLSMNIWWYVVLAFFLYSFGGLALNYKKEYSKRSTRKQSNKAKNKYLPKKKR